MIYLFWTSLALLVYTQLGYGLLLWLLAPSQREWGGQPVADVAPASLIIAAHDEAQVIAAKVRNAQELQPRPQLIICCDGCSDGTAAAARAAGADIVLELPRGGKVRAQDAGVRAATGELLFFSDANSVWESGALLALAAAFACDSRVGYACGQVRFLSRGGDNQEGLYWRYEMRLREWESRLGSITAGNGAIYATRRDSYIEVDPIMGHDLSFPFNMVKRGWRAVYVPDARATEKMVPTIDGEFARKRRMMSHTWPIILRGGMLAPRGFGPRYAWMLLSHRVLRYLSPLLHAMALLSNLLLLGHGTLYLALLVAQLAVLGAAALAGSVRSRALLLARYYVLSTASIAFGLWDWLRHGTTAAWEAAEGTR